MGEGPVFILGIPRSGTTLLYGLLQRLPAFRCRNDPRGFQLTESGAFAFPPHCLRARRGIGPFGYLLRRRDLLPRIRAAASPATWVFSPLWRLSLAVSPLRRLFWRWAGNDRLMRAYFEAAAEARGVERILEKTPRHAAYLPELFGVFPDAKVLFCERHPVYVYGSMRRRAQRDPSPWLRVSPRRFAADYDRRQRALEEARVRWGDRIRRVRYERLVTEPEAVLREICGFLGVAFDETLLRPADPDPSRRKAPHEDPIRAESPSWQPHLGPDEARDIERRLARWLPQLGYAPCAP